MTSSSDHPLSGHTGNEGPYMANSLGDNPHEKWWVWTPGRVAGAVVTVCIISFWVWAFSPLPDRGNPDRLDDRAYVTAAEGICAVAQTQIADLPSAGDVATPAERADLLDTGTVVVRQLILDLRTVRPDADSEATIIRFWLDDWETYADDRDHYAGQLRTGDFGGVDDRFTVTTRAGLAVSTHIDGFARVNDMDSCLTPGDA
jgi:hypothetical protein